MAPIKFLYKIGRAGIYEGEVRPIWQFLPSTVYYWAYLETPDRLWGPFKSPQLAQKGYEIAESCENGTNVVNVDFKARRRV